MNSIFASSNVLTLTRAQWAGLMALVGNPPEVQAVLERDLKARVTELLGTTAFRTQIWTAITVYLLVAILKRRLHLEASLYTILQILSLTLFEKMPIAQALAQLPAPTPSADHPDHQCLPGF